MESIQVWRSMSVIPAFWKLRQGLPEVHCFEIHCEFQARPARGRTRHLLGKNGRKEGREGEKEGGGEAKSPVLKHWQALSMEGNSIPHSITDLALYTWPCFQSQSHLTNHWCWLFQSTLEDSVTLYAAPQPTWSPGFYPYWLLATDSVLVTGHSEQALQHLRKHNIFEKGTRDPKQHSFLQKQKCKCHKRRKSGSEPQEAQGKWHIKGSRQCWPHCLFRITGRQRDMTHEC